MPETGVLKFKPSLRRMAQLVKYSMDGEQTKPGEPEDVAAAYMQYLVEPEGGWPKGWTDEQRLDRLKDMDDVDMAQVADGFLSSPLTQDLPNFIDKLLRFIEAMVNLQNRLVSLGVMEAPGDEPDEKESEETPKPEYTSAGSSPCSCGPSWASRPWRRMTCRLQMSLTGSGHSA
jgi:hypothetical protein